MNLINYTKWFTSKSVADDNAGIIKRTLEHLLKLHFMFDYERDKNTHRKSIIGWVMKIQGSINKDNTFKSKLAMIQRFFQKNPPDKLCKEFNRHFKSSYNFSGKVDEDDIFDSLHYFNLLLDCNSKDEMMRVLDQMEIEW